MRLVVLLLVAAVVLLAVRGPGGSELVPGAMALIAFLVFGFAVLLMALDRRAASDRGRGDSDTVFLATVILLGFAARVVLAALIHHTGIHEIIAPDEETFHRNGVQFSQWLAGETPYRLSWRFLDSLQVGYYYLVGGLYYVFGVEPFVPILLNCILGAITAIPIYRIARDLHDRAAARSAAVLVTFFPSVLLWSTLLVRDTLVILVLLLIVRAVMLLRTSFRPERLLWLALLFVGLASLRQYLFLLVAASALATFLVGAIARSARSLAAGLVVLLALLAIVKYAGFGIWELERASLFHLNLHRQYNAVASTGSIMPEVDISEPVSALTYLPVGVIYFLGSPFPWQVFSSRQIMALPDVLVWYLLLPPIFIGLAVLIRQRFRDAAMLLITTAMITVLYALVEGNVGIIFRHRAQVIVPLMVAAGIGISVRRERKRTSAPVRAAS